LKSGEKAPQRPLVFRSPFQKYQIVSKLETIFPNKQNALTQFQDAGISIAMSQNVQKTPPGIHYAQYEAAKEAEYLPQIRQLISSDLSEPYSIYVYRYFLYQWAELCFMVCYHLPNENLHWC
jgi:hypothetical protein